MESPADAAAAENPFSQVVFNDIPRSYPPSTPITCRFTLNAAFQPQSRDWVGIFKVGWSTAKDYHTFVWVEPNQDMEGQEAVMRQAVFKEYYLPKDEMEFYQFCYADSTGQVRGASTPFCFKTPEGQSMDSSPDDDLMVITTQEQVEQGMHEKAELQNELDRKREENAALKSDLQKKEQEADILKGQSEQKEKENSCLVKELEEIKELNKNLQSTLEQQLQEMESVKEELLVQTKQAEIQEQDAAEQKKLISSYDEASRRSQKQTQEKYDQAVLKINQLKEERQELRDKVDVQSEEMSQLRSKFRERERELLKAKDSNQLLQVDLRSSERDNERLTAELQRLQGIAYNIEDMKRANQELNRELLQLGTQQDSPQDDLRVQCQTLVNQLQDTQEKLAAEKGETRKAKARMESLEQELMQARKQLDTVLMTCDQEQRKSSKFELQLRDALEAIADKEGLIEEKEHLMRLVKHENEEVIIENQNLRSDIEGLRRVYSDLHAAQAADSLQVQPDTNSPGRDTSASHEQQQQQQLQQETPDQLDNLYENIESLAEAAEETLVCCHCRERFPGITPDELEQHQESHRVCPFCTMICDNMEQSVFEDHVYSHEL
ncbi:calcium-binding and coiled-coil domain-containing protein 2 [Solea solea]|uniref:calcium-binding and coiled-coil domain-containing protein 2 n=1 Tax=Solea solea TaxID=90069 RepID=UPI00272BEEB5|nr:calcium-binding and coiled-coil domain-containing protein 2 [Solea solea]